MGARLRGKVAIVTGASSGVGRAIARAFGEQGLPAVNTPHFEVVRNRLKKHPQPVPPIYQPEVIAEASSLIESDLPIVVQHARLDSCQAEQALLSTIAYSQ